MLEGLTPSIEITIFLVKLSGVFLFLDFAEKSFKSNRVLESKGLFCCVTQRYSPKEYFFWEEGCVTR